MRINFDFLDLEAFIAVMDTGSFNLAAEKLGLSQSSVTRRIQKLEQALNVQLFTRTTRDVRPTLAAKQLRTRAETILNEAIEATQTLQDESIAFAHQQARTLTIAALPTVIASLVAPAVAGFRQTRPDTRFRILDVSANEVAEAVSQGEADLGICSAPAYEPATQFERLFVDEMLLAMPSQHELAQRKTLAWQELADESLVLPAKGTGNRALIDEALARASVPRLWTLEVGRTATALDLVRCGVALAPVPSSAIIEGTGPWLAAARLSGPAVSRTIGLLTKAGQMSNPRLAAFVDRIKQSCTDR